MNNERAKPRIYAANLAGLHCVRNMRLAKKIDEARCYRMWRQSPLGKERGVFSISLRPFCRANFIPRVPHRFQGVLLPKFFEPYSRDYEAFKTIGISDLRENTFLAEDRRSTYFFLIIPFFSPRRCCYYHGMENNFSAEGI